MKTFLSNFFKLAENNTDVNRELMAGLTTFITMAYIIFVNPQLMASSGMDQGASFVGTCLAAALACLVMGIFANWPVGLAPGMGLNAFFTFTVVGEMGYSWQVALGAVMIAGVLFFLMSVTPLRRWMLDSIPLNLRIAMGSGVGLFIGFIGLKSGGIIVANGATFVSMGDLTNPETLMAALGFILIAGLSVRNVPGAIIIGVLTITLLALGLGFVEYQGLVAYPPDVSSTFLQLDILGALDVAMGAVIASFLFV
ncbi:MAG: NCS2 family permease, partial [Rhodobacterales bacterium]|nr:NCS2 family permease [Rhodobacterales bacterium]